MAVLRVMVAEDDDLIRAAIVTLLSSLDLDVVEEVSNGEQLVQAAVLHKPDIIVSDIAMPLLDGLSARRELSSRGIEIPFVFVTMMSINGLLFTDPEEPVGYVYKADLLDELEPAVRAVAAGSIYVSRSFRNS